MDRLMSRWTKDLSKVHKRLDYLHPSTKLPPIPSPVRGEPGCKREVNVTLSLRDAIERANSTLTDDQEKYIQFMEGYTDKKLNSDAKDALDALMLQHIGSHYGRQNWKTASRTTHREQCEAVIRQAAASRDFLVFRQTAFYWAIRDLAEQKMKSKGRGRAALIDANKSAKRDLAASEAPVKRARGEEGAIASRATTNSVISTIHAETGASRASRGRGGVRVSGRVRGIGRGRGGGRGRGRGRAKASV